MSFYYIGMPDQENPYRWTYNLGVRSSEAILAALRGAGFSVQPVATTVSIAPFLMEIDIAKPGATREEVERIMATAEPAAEPKVVAKRRQKPRARDRKSS